ncbi:MAG: hypothetical protein V4724_04020 [Pseudomonadota bacterium]
MATVVDRGILLDDADGRHTAVAYMEREQIPLTVIARVLCKPSSRRSSGTPNL